MALKKNQQTDETQESPTMKKAKQLFSNEPRRKRENKILTTFSIEPSFKRELEDLFADMGLGWAAGIRFSLREFYKKYKDN